MAPKFLCLLFLTISVKFCFCINVKSLNQTIDATQSAVATWYGPDKGPRSGGGCGLANDVANPPYSSMISAGNQALFQKGVGCGACYQASCSEPECSGTPITVTITDECPGACNNDPVHFDFSGFAFGAMAKSGQGDALRKRGRINIQYQRVPCKYNNFNIVFKVTTGSNPNFFSTAVENVNGDGTVKSLEIQTAGTSTWNAMTEDFGATYKWNVPTSDIGKAYSIRITSGDGKQVTAENVIPGDWKAGQSYKSNTNF